MEIKENVPLAPLTTFKIGGSAKHFVDVAAEDEIREALAWAHEKGLKFIKLLQRINSMTQVIEIYRSKRRNR